MYLFFRSLVNNYSNPPKFKIFQTPRKKSKFTYSKFCINKYYETSLNFLQFVIRFLGLFAISSVVPTHCSLYRIIPLCGPLCVSTHYAHTGKTLKEKNRLCISPPCVCAHHMRPIIGQKLQ